MKEITPKQRLVELQKASPFGLNLSDSGKLILARKLSIPLKELERLIQEIERETNHKANPPQQEVKLFGEAN